MKIMRLFPPTNWEKIFKKMPLSYKLTFSGLNNIMPRLRSQ